MAKDTSIDNVTPANLGFALRMSNINIDHDTLDKIIDLVELLEQSGDAVTLGQIAGVQAKWVEANF